MNKNRKYSVYISVLKCVCVNPIKLTAEFAEPIGPILLLGHKIPELIGFIGFLFYKSHLPKFFVGPRVTPGKVYE